VNALHSCEPGIRFIVVDDGLEVPWIESVKGEKPFIFARNANIGIRAAGSDDVVLLNDDALLKTIGGLSAMWQLIYKDQQCGVLSASVNAANHLLPYSLSFVCVLIPRLVINTVGLLDERFTGEIDGEMVYGGEDDDYCYRVRKVGMRVDVFPGCVVDHRSLPSTFRGMNGSLPINATRKRFREIHGFEMRTR
jgi:GT2 family glycosyltransferase